MSVTLAALSADCGACHGFCCIAPQTRRELGFAFAKPALEPCRHLLSEPYSCDIHHRLAEEGCGGCVDYTCHGAGPLLTRFAEGRDLHWPRRPPDDPERRRLLEQFLELHALFSALAGLRERAAHDAAFAPELDAFERRLEGLGTERLIDEALELGFAIRGVLWDAECGEDVMV